ncbi:MAG: lipopolysaccharide biosynthesis protein [Butyrivibrio sp.]|nr:lipopolysaccharide biosynthesis protein [Butyrivibrio sp.]
MARQENLKEKTIKGFVWAYSERFAAYVIQMLVSIILARLIEPEHYGIISIVTVMITFADIFVSSGFGTSLVQKQDADELDFNTAFTCGFIMSCILYGILFISAPYIEKFYKMSELSIVIRIMAIRLPIASINTIQHAKIQKNMEFKKFFFSTLIGTLISAVVGIVLALMGFKIWALVGQYLTNSIIDTIVLLLACRWFPKLQLSISRAKKIMGFGWKVLAQNLIFTLTGNIQTLVIGKRFSSAELAFYDNGVKIPSAVLSNIYGTVGKVIFPALSSIQDDYVKRKNIIRQAVQLCTFILSPVAVGLLVTAEPVITLLYTDKWLPCVPFLQIYCLRFLSRPLTTIAQSATMSVGRSDIILKMEVILNICLFSTLFVAVYIFNSVNMIAWGGVIEAGLAVILHTMNLKRIIGYTYKEQMRDTLPSYLSGLIMGIFVYCERAFINNTAVLLFVQCCTGIIVYVGLAYVINRNSILYIMGLVKKVQS